MVGPRTGDGVAFRTGKLDWRVYSAVCENRLNGFQEPMPAFEILHSVLILAFGTRLQARAASAV